MKSYLPKDEFTGTLIGRAWVPASLTGTVAGPSPILLNEDGVLDLSSLAPTCSELLNMGFSQREVVRKDYPRLGSYP